MTPTEREQEQARAIVMATNACDNDDCLLCVTCDHELEITIAAALATREREVRADERQKVWGEAINTVNYAVETMTRFAHKDFEAARNERNEG